MAQRRLDRWSRSAEGSDCDQLRRLQAVDRSKLSADQLNYDTILYTRKSQTDVQRFDFGGSGSALRPVMVSRLTGSYLAVGLPRHQAHHRGVRT